MWLQKHLISHFPEKNDCCHDLMENALNERIDPRDLAIGTMFLSQMIVGILGNFSLLYCYLVLYYNVSTLRATDLFLKHLMIANSLVILSKGVPQTMAALGLKHFFNDFGCHLILYFQRVGRSVSIAITCLLSVFQNIRISPMNSCWKDLKVKAPKYTGFSISLFWILYMVVNFSFPLYAYGILSSTNDTMVRDLGYCSIANIDKITGSIYASLFVFTEVVFSVLMIWSGGSMIFILYQHKHRVQHIHSMNVSARPSPEYRATQTILVLVCTFVTFYTLSSILSVYTALFHNPYWWLLQTIDLISLCFPTISPFVLMSRDSAVSRICFVWIRNTKFRNVISTCKVYFCTLFYWLVTNHNRNINTELVEK